MKKTRHARFAAFEKLSARAQQLVISGLEADLTQEEIRLRLSEATGEDFSKGSLSRFAVDWRMHKALQSETRQKAKFLIELAKEGNLDGIEFGEALIQDALLATTEGGQPLDLEKLHAYNLRYREAQIKQKEMEIKERMVEIKAETLDLQERKITALEAKVRAMTEKADAAKKAIGERQDLPAEVIQRIREIYDLGGGAPEVADAA